MVATRGNFSTKKALKINESTNYRNNLQSELTFYDVIENMYEYFNE